MAKSYRYWNHDGFIARTPVDIYIPIELWNTSKSEWFYWDDVSAFMHDSQPASQKEVAADMPAEFIDC